MGLIPCPLFSQFTKIASLYRFKRAKENFIKRHFNALTGGVMKLSAHARTSLELTLRQVWYYIWLNNFNFILNITEQNVVIQSRAIWSGVVANRKRKRKNQSSKNKKTTKMKRKRMKKRLRGMQAPTILTWVQSEAPLASAVLNLQAVGPPSLWANLLCRTLAIDLLQFYSATFTCTSSYTVLHRLSLPISCAPDRQLAQY